MSETLVSVVMTNFNKGHYVREAIQSILSQTYSNFELIVVDDGSTDESPSIIKEFEREDGRIVFISGHHVGASSARNLGIEKARGDLIAFMDSDDTCSKERVSRQVRLFNKKEIFVCYTDGWIIDQASVPTGAIYSRDFERIPDSGGDGYIFSKLLRRNHIIGSSVMMPKQVLSVERFDERLSIGYDTDLWVRLAQCFPFRYISEPLYGYRVYDGNTWSKKNEVVILRNHIRRYQKWLSSFDNLRSEDRRIILKHMWKSYARLRDRSGMIKLAMTDWMAFSLFASGMKRKISYKLRLFPRKKEN